MRFPSSGSSLPTWKILKNATHWGWRMGWQILGEEELRVGPGESIHQYNKLVIALINSSETGSHWQRLIFQHYSLNCSPPTFKSSQSVDAIKDQIYFLIKCRKMGICLQRYSLWVQKCKSISSVRVADSFYCSCNQAGQSFINAIINLMGWIVISTCGFKSRLLSQ